MPTFSDVKRLLARSHEAPDEPGDAEAPAPVRPNALRSPGQPAHVWPGAEVEAVDGTVRVSTDPAPWANAAAFAVPLAGVEGGQPVFAAVRATRGRVGLSLVAADLVTGVGKETIVADGETVVLALTASGAHGLVHVLVRNASVLDTPSQVEIVGLGSGAVPVVELDADDVGAALRSPAALHRDLVERGWRGLPGTVDEWERVRPVPLRVVHPVPLKMPDPAAVFPDEVGRVVLESVRDLRAAVERFDDRPVADHIATSCIQEAYLLMNTVRVVRLVDAIRRRNNGGRRILEVGAWFGSFALPLARLGYDVTAVDRYGSYGRAFETFTDLMGESGVRVVSTTREDEEGSLDDLGHFDVVFAGAVIEHVPHTPRTFLERLAAAVEPGGLLAVDTPNLARYWNRRTLSSGGSTFQPIAEQFFAEPPWEGHHREYTASELAWMLEQVGCVEVETEWFDYNLLQFEVLSEEHVEALCRFLEDPSECDMVLAAGRVPPRTGR